MGNTENILIEIKYKIDEKSKTISTDVAIGDSDMDVIILASILKSCFDHDRNELLELFTNAIAKVFAQDKTGNLANIYCEIIREATKHASGISDIEIILNNANVS